MAELDKRQLAHLTTMLDQRYRLLKEQVEQDLDRSGESSYIDIAGQVHDTGDESLADLLSDMNAAAVHREIAEMRDIEDANRRIREDQYGECIECGAQIGFARLSAYPTAKRCIDCQTRQEKMSAGVAGPSL
jgi:DnaK suppressor protein